MTQGSGFPPDAPLTTAAFMRELGLSLEVRPTDAENADAVQAWTCLLRRADGRSYEVTNATFVVFEDDAQWQVEPTPSAVVEMLRMDAFEREEGDDEEAAAVSDVAGQSGGGAAADDDEIETPDPAIRAFLGDEGLALLARVTVEDE